MGAVGVGWHRTHDIGVENPGARGGCRRLAARVRPGNGLTHVLVIQTDV